MTSIRTFIAINIDEENVVKKISQVQQCLWKTQAALKLVEPHNLHLTLRFLGNTQTELIEKVKLKLEEIVFHPFTVNIQKIGGFPNNRRPRIIWAGIQEESNQLPQIANQLEEKLSELGFPSEKRRFSPHLTIARVRAGKKMNELTTTIAELEDIEFGTMRVKCLKLKKSELTSHGPIYTTLKETCQEDR